MNASFGPDPALLGTPPMVGGPFDLLPAASANAAELDALYLFITGLCLVAVVLVTGTQLWFMVRYSRPASGHRRTSPIKQSRRLELLWSVIPAVLFLVIFAWGEVLYVKTTAPLGDALEVRITGQQWSWTVEYPGIAGGVLTDQLILPADVPVRLTLTSRDVIHSFYIPVFRLKKDAIPGRYTTMWVTATEPGVYPIFCAEYCGEQHSSMIGKVRVVESLAVFEDYLAPPHDHDHHDSETMEDFGRRVWDRSGCGSCHSLDGAIKVGPSLAGIYGARETLDDGSTIVVDDDYIRESIIDPSCKVVRGFTPQMPSFAGRLDDKALAGLIEFIKASGGPSVP